MQDKRRRNDRGNLLNDVVDRALQQAVEGMSPEEAKAALRQIRSDLGTLLASACPPASDLVADMGRRAELAAAFRISLPEEEN